MHYSSTACAAALTAAALLTPTTASAAPPTRGDCGPGELCLWERPEYTGTRHTYDLSGMDLESCLALPEGGSAQALANRTGRPVTTYQSAVCAETAEFDTYPGGGTWVPKAPYKVRAVKIWEN